MAEKNGPSVGWLAAGGLVGVGLYFLSKELYRAWGASRIVPAGHETVAAPIPSAQAPSSFPNLAAVESRFAQLRDRYHMYLDFDGAVAEANLLENAAQRLSATEPNRATALVSDLEDFKRQVLDAKAFQQSLAAPPA